MKKAQQIDISKPNVKPEEITKCLNQYYEWIKEHPANQLKLSKKTKALKMISNISAMIQNNSNNIDPYLHDISTILNYIISPTVEQQVHLAAINCLCLLISAVNQNYEADLYIVIEFMFMVPSDFEKKVKGAKLESVLNESYSALLSGLESSEDLNRQKVWFALFFNKIIPTIQKSRQPESIIIKWMSSFVKTTTDIFMKASKDNKLEQYLQDDSSFIILQTMSIFPTFYKADDRDLTITFYHVLFSSSFYRIDCAMSCTKFAARKSMESFFDEKCPSGWGGPDLISNLYSQPNSFFRKFVQKFITGEAANQHYMAILGPILESIFYLMTHCKEGDHVRSDLFNLYTLVLRLRNAIYLSFRLNENKQHIDTSLRCLILCTIKMNPLYTEYLPFSISFYLTCLFDSKYSNVKEIYNFVKSLINIEYSRGLQNRNIAPQICAHVITLITITLAPFLLDLSPTESKIYLTNSIGMKNTNKPISNQLMHPIVTNSVYFYFKILGCDFNELLSETNSELSISKSKSGWDKQKATRFIMNLVDAIDPLVDHTASATVADNLTIICRQTIISNQEFICRNILPCLFNSVLYKSSNESIILPVLRRVVRNLFDMGYMNTAMANDWLQVIQKHIFSEKVDVSNEMLYAAANSITRGYQYSTSMIPLFITKVYENSSSSVAYGQHVNLICTCLVNIIIITKNMKEFKVNDQKSIDLLFNKNKKYITMFMNFLNRQYSLSQICISILQKICQKLAKNDLSSIQNLILLIFYQDAFKTTEKVDPVIEGILIDIFFKPDNFASITSEFYSILFVLTNHYHKLIKKCPNLYTKLFETIFYLLVNNQNLKQRDFKLLLYLSTDYVLFNASEDLIYQFMSILSAPGSDENKQKILNEVFDYFLLNYQKPNNAMKTIDPDLIIFQKSGNIFIHHFNENNQIDTYISRKQVSARYSLTFGRSKTSDELVNSTDIEKFLSAPSLGLIYEVFSESSGEPIRAVSGNDNRVANRKFGLLARNAYSRQQRVLVETEAVFVGHNQLKREQFLMNTEGNVSEDFYRFLRSLGCYYNRSNIPFLPNIARNLKDDSMNDEKVVCWSDLRNNFVCSILPFMKSDSIEERWDRLKKRKILIIWSENTEQINFFNEGFLTEGVMEVAFVLRPFSKSLIQISIIKKTKKMPVFGFFKKTMLLPANIVGFCISNMILLADELNRDDTSSNDKLKGYNGFFTKALVGDLASFNPS